MAIGLVGVHQYVLLTTTDWIFTIAAAPKRSVILVLGASVQRGRPSPILGERLRAAAELYHSGRAPKIIVSGDHGQTDYDEVHPMAHTLEQWGVPAADIFLDHAGFRTFDSIERARSVFGVEDMLVVTNPFHLARALFLARSLGIDAAGVAADYGVDYSVRTRLGNEGREALARILAFCDVFLLDTKPRFLGPRIDLGGDGRTTRE